MNKQEFLDKLREGLSGLPQEDMEGRLTFYGEVIDDRVEEGMSEEDAVSDVGNVEDIVAQIVAEYPLTRLVKEKVKPKRSLAAWEIILLIVGSPIWISLLFGVASGLFCVYVAIWSVAITLGAAGVSLVGGLVGGVISAIALAVQGNTIGGLAMLGAGLICAGVAILIFFACRLAVKGTVILTRKMAFAIKKMFMKRGNE